LINLLLQYLFYVMSYERKQTIHFFTANTILSFSHIKIQKSNRHCSSITVISFRKSTMTNFSISSSSAFVSYSKSTTSSQCKNIVLERLSIPGADTTTDHNNNSSHEEQRILATSSLNPDDDISVIDFHLLPKMPILDDDCAIKLKLKHKNNKIDELNSQQERRNPLFPPINPSSCCCYRPSTKTKRQKLEFHSLCDDENESLTRHEADVSTRIRSQDRFTHDADYDEEQDETDTPVSFIKPAERSTSITSSKSPPPLFEIMSDDWFLYQLHIKGSVFLPPRFSNLSSHH
jgi:hypothetical protein